MIKRELHMSCIPPFIGTGLIKGMTGICRCWKSVMLEMIRKKLAKSGANPIQFTSINFEDMAIPICEPRRLYTTRSPQEPQK